MYILCVYVYIDVYIYVCVCVCVYVFVQCRNICQRPGIFEIIRAAFRLFTNLLRLDLNNLIKMYMSLE